MTNLKRSAFQAHPFHLVSPSPWPLYTSISLLTLTCSGVLTMHNFTQATYFLFLALITLILCMALWWRDVISEGRAKSFLLHLLNLNFILKTTRVITTEEIGKSLISFKEKITPNSVYNDEKEFAYYLAGLLEGDGHISLPSLGVTTLNRVLNPRIIFTSHKNNLGLYAYIQFKLGGIGRFQLAGDNIIRYIIGDIKGIVLIVNSINGKFRTPKNKRLNDLIKFINAKYSLEIQESLLDYSDLVLNSWFTGFTEADGHFGVKIVEAKSKSDTRKKSVSENISLKFRLDQRLFDKPNNSYMFPIMEKIGCFLSCEVKSYKIKPAFTEILSVSVQSITKVQFLIKYFNKYPLLGVKEKDFKCWEMVYYIIVSKEHLTEKGKLKIRCIASEMKENKK